jgi:hypothetical protein
LYNFPSVLKYKILIPLLLLLALLFFIPKGGNIKKDSLAINELTLGQDCFIFPEDEVRPDLTPKNVWNEIIRLEIKEPEIVMKQAITETGWFKCRHCSLDSNNIFGFRIKKRYLKFDHWTGSVAYYKRWQDRHYKGGDYYKFLERKGYSHSPTYTNYLRTVKLHFLEEKLE